MTKVLSKEDEKVKARRKLALQKKFSQRITIARQGREAFSQKDYLGAAAKYNEYLNILSELNDLDNIYSLSPIMFDNKKEITELLLISHIYWDIARINEMTPKLQNNFLKALSQFVKFTINQPYQVLNAEMLRKYIKKNKKTSKQITSLNETYQQIFVQSSKCFIATMCFGHTHQDTVTLRRFKQLILKRPLGLSFVRFYYKNSSKLVLVCEQNKVFKILIVGLCKPILSLFAKTLQLSIFK
jgi:hypothetical protein